jgi:hypothetical protein
MSRSFARRSNARVGAPSDGAAFSSRSRPTARRLARAAWVAQRQTELLDCPYFHVVLTVPEPIAQIALQNKALVYGILFRATAETLQTIAADPRHLGAEIGVLADWFGAFVSDPYFGSKCFRSIFGFTRTRETRHSLWS